MRTSAYDNRNCNENAQNLQAVLCAQALVWILFIIILLIRSVQIQVGNYVFRKFLLKFDFQFDLFTFLHSSRTRAGISTNTRTRLI